MTAYMLDSNVLIDVVRDPDGAVSKAFQGRDTDNLSISVVVSGEIDRGMLKNPRTRSNARMEYLLRSLKIEHLDAEAGRIYADLRFSMDRRGKSISPNDYWIIAHALLKEATLVTGDQAIYEAGIPLLKLESWRGDTVLQSQD